MSGHSKWSQIKHKKAATDAKRSKEFGRLARLISAESRLAGGDPNAPGVKVLVEKAKAVNMPKDNIERAIAKGAGGGQNTYQSVTYEMYGPGGVAIMIDTETDNTNRTVAELKHLVSKQGYVLANPGGASWAFAKSSGEWHATTTVPIGDEDALQLGTLVEALEDHDDVLRVTVNAE